MYLQPSSSARAAELLGATGASSTGFVGFGALSGDLGYVPVSVQGSDEADSSVDPDFRLVLRKLSKRDTTTKLKVSAVLLYCFQNKTTLMTVVTHVSKSVDFSYTDLC